MRSVGHILKYSRFILVWVTVYSCLFVYLFVYLSRATGKWCENLWPLMDPPSLVARGDCLILAMHWKLAGSSWKKLESGARDFCLTAGLVKWVFYKVFKTCQNDDNLPGTQIVPLAF